VAAGGTGDQRDGSLPALPFRDDRLEEPRPAVVSLPVRQGHDSETRIDAPVCDLGKKGTTGNKRSSRIVSI
jgi:hypothetical protein